MTQCKRYDLGNGFPKIIYINFQKRISFKDNRKYANKSNKKYERVLIYTY